MNNFQTVLLVLNALWFGMAFHYFFFKSTAAAKLLVPKAQRETPLFEIQSSSLRFLGTMNLALASLALLLLFNASMFSQRGQWALFAVVFAVAHAGQFYCNVPIALKNRTAEPGVWPVLKGPMRVIFIVDASLMLANAVLAAMLLI